MRKIDSMLLGVIFILCLFGLFMIYNASSVIALRDFQDKYYYIKEQAVWMVLGLLALFFFSMF